MGQTPAQCAGNGVSFGGEAFNQGKRARSFKQGQVAVAAALVKGDVFQQRGQQGGAHIVPAFGHGVFDFDGVFGGKAEIFEFFFTQKINVFAFVKAQAGQLFAEQLQQIHAFGIVIKLYKGAAFSGRNAVKARKTCGFFSQIPAVVQVTPVRGRLKRPLAAGGVKFQRQARKNVFEFIFGDIRPQDTVNLCGGKTDDGVFIRLRIYVAYFGRRAAAGGHKQFRGAF